MEEIIHSENVEMAEQHRPVSRYRQNIAADTSQLVHNINGKRPEYAHGYRKPEVYEQYARPSSRRSSVPVSEAQCTERPTTSRGRRIHPEQEIPAYEPERPSSRRSHRSNAPVEGTERPVTRHGRRESMPERPVTRHGRRSQEDFHEGSQTRRERAQSDTGQPVQDYHEGSTSRIDILRLEDGPEPTPTPPTKPNMRMRPKSAKGRIRPKAAPRPSLNRDETPTPASIISPPPPYVMSPTPQHQVMTPVPHTADSRPSSSLNKFNPLPSIGRKASVDADIMEMNYPRPSPRGVAPKSVIQNQINNRKNEENTIEDSYSYSDSYHNLRSQLQRLKTQDNLFTKDETDDKPVPKPRVKQQAATTANNTHNQGPQNDPVIVSVEPEPEYQPLTRKVVLPAEPNLNDEHFILAVKLPSGARPQRRFRPSDSLETVMHFAELSSQLDFEGCELVCDVPSHLVLRDLKVSIQHSGLKNRTVLHVQIPDADEEE